MTVAQQSGDGSSEVVVVNVAEFMSQPRQGMLFEERTPSHFETARAQIIHKRELDSGLLIATCQHLQKLAEPYASGPAASLVSLGRALSRVAERYRDGQGPDARKEIESIRALVEKETAPTVIPSVLFPDGLHGKRVKLEPIFEAIGKAADHLEETRGEGFVGAATILSPMVGKLESKRRQ